MTEELDGDTGERLHLRRDRASVFGSAATLYDRSRPRYPEALLDTILAAHPSNGLDVGCGTGILAAALHARGLEVTGVEPDPRMAEVARAKGLPVEISTFEEWDAQGRRFDVVTSGQAWHWVEPVAGAAKAALVLERGGRLVLAWNVGTMDPELRGRLDPLYESIAPGLARPTVIPVPDEWLRPGGSEHALAESGCFGEISREVYVWDRDYSTEEWIEILGTHSDHMLLDEDDRNQLLDAVRREIDRVGGSFTMRYDTRATFAVRAQ